MQQDRRSDGAIALIAGVALAVMINLNSALALHSSPILASWIAHGVGVLASVALISLWPTPARRADEREGSPTAPFWSHLGGIPGATTVLLAAVTVNGPLGLAGTLALVLVGQVIFGVTVDGFGLLGMARRRLTSRDLVAVAFVIAGSVMIILSRI